MPSEKFLELMRKKKEQQIRQEQIPPALIQQIREIPSEPAKELEPENIEIKEEHKEAKEIEIPEEVDEEAISRAEVPLLIKKLMPPQGSLKYEYKEMRMWLDRTSWEKLKLFNASAVTRLALAELFNNHSTEQIYILSRPYDYNTKRQARYKKLAKIKEEMENGI